MVRPFPCPVYELHRSTVSEIISGVPNKIIMVLSNYPFSNIATTILDFSILILVKLSRTLYLPLLYFWYNFFASFIYFSFYNCHYFLILKAIAKSKGKINAIAFKSDNYRKERSKEIIPKKKAKKIITKKSYIAIAIL